MATQKSIPAAKPDFQDLIDASPASFQAEMTKQQCMEADALHEGSGCYAVARRITMIVLTRSSKQILESTKKDKELKITFDILEYVDAFIKNCECALSLARTAQARLLWAGAKVSEERGAAKKTTKAKRVKA